MFNYQDFDDVFSFDTECSYDEETIKSIEMNRKKLEGLFIEKVMKLMGIKRPPRYYPPKTNADLRNLHKVIVETNAQDHEKISVLFYLLQPFDDPTGKREFSNEFEKKYYLPARYSIYMKGLWHLDRQEFRDAVQYLTSPTLIPTFPDEILEVLVRHASPHNDLTLPLSYYHTVLPSLTTQSSVEHLHSALCRTSVTEAFYFSRSQPEPTRLHMFEMLISLVLHNSPAETIADRSVELVNLPFSEEEEKWFEEYLLNGEGRGLKKARDTVMMRRIGTGRFEESLALRKGVSGRAINGLDWSSLVGAVQDGLGPRVEV